MSIDRRSVIASAAQRLREGEQWAGMTKMERQRILDELSRDLDAALSAAPWALAERVRAEYRRAAADALALSHAVKVLHDTTGSK